VGQQRPLLSQWTSRFRVGWQHYLSGLVGSEWASKRLMLPERTSGVCVGQQRPTFPSGPVGFSGPASKVQCCLSGPVRSEWASKGQHYLSEPVGSEWASKGPHCLSGPVESTCFLSGPMRSKWVSRGRCCLNELVGSVWASKGQHYLSKWTSGVWVGQ